MWYRLQSCESVFSLFVMQNIDRVKSLGVLKCWNFEVLKYWSVEVLKCWSVEVWKGVCGSVEVLKCWSVEVWKCETLGSVGVVNKIRLIIKRMKIIG